MKVLFFPVTALALAALTAGCDAKKVDPVQRGAYLVATMGCNDCHTPVRLDPAIGMPVPDGSRLLSGHPAAAPQATGNLGGHDAALVGPTFTEFTMPFGKVYARNLTPDPETGLGGWTAEDFIRTARTGRWKGIGRPLLPPMPWMNMNAATDEDLRAIFDRTFLGSSAVHRERAAKLAGW